MNLLTSLTRTAQISAVLTALALFPVSVLAQEEGFTNLFPAGSGTATKPDDLTLGRISQANGGGTFITGATAIGSNAFALGAGSTSLGSDSGPGVTLAGVTSIGANANFNNATGIFSTAMGAGATQATGPDSSGNYSVAIGGGDGVGGTGAISSGAQSVAVGLSSAASGTNSTAIGARTTASGTNSVVLGTSSTASTANAIAIGNNSKAITGAGATAIGANTTASGASSIALGSNTFSATGAQATGAFTQAYGDGAIASGNSSIAMGVGAVSSSNGSIAMQNFATASGNAAIAVGLSSSATGAQAIAFGNNAAASGANGVAIGNAATANFSNSTALGNGAVVTRANQMAFGTGTNTYTMPGITSAASAAAQAGPTEFVTTDAAGNLSAVNLGASFNTLNQEINTLSNRIHDVRQEERGGVALAMAAGQIRYDDRPGKVSIGGGLGVFEDEGGGALGIGFTSPNARVRGNISAGGSFRGDFGGGAGLSITLN